MKIIIKKVLLAVLLLINLSTLLFDWQIIEGITSRGGLSVLTSNVILSGMILCMYFLSLLLYNKSKITFFTIGLCSLSMLAALELSKFESYGGFNNSAIWPYLGIFSIIITIVLYILLLRKETFIHES